MNLQSEPELALTGVSVEMMVWKWRPSLSSAQLPTCLHPAPTTNKCNPAEKLRPQICTSHDGSRSEFANCLLVRYCAIIGAIIGRVYGNAWQICSLQDGIWRHSNDDISMIVIMSVNIVIIVTIVTIKSIFWRYLMNLWQTWNALNRPRL